MLNKKEILEWIDQASIDNYLGQWIETKDKIPEEHTDVLGVDNNGDFKVCWIDNYNKGFYMTNGNDQIPYSQVNIIKWMPLPKP